MTVIGDAESGEGPQCALDGNGYACYNAWMKKEAKIAAVWFVAVVVMLGTMIGGRALYVLGPDWLSMKTFGRQEFISGPDSTFMIFLTGAAMIGEILLAAAVTVYFDSKND